LAIISNAIHNTMFIGEGRIVSRPAGEMACPGKRSRAWRSRAIRCVAARCTPRARRRHRAPRDSRAPCDRRERPHLPHAAHAARLPRTSRRGLFARCEEPRGGERRPPSISNRESLPTGSRFARSQAPVARSRSWARSTDSGRSQAPQPALRTPHSAPRTPHPAPCYPRTWLQIADPTSEPGARSPEPGHTAVVHSLRPVSGAAPGVTDPPPGENPGQDGRPRAGHGGLVVPSRTARRIHAVSGSRDSPGAIMILDT
jgi:hypothetical protein